MFLLLWNQLFDLLLQTHPSAPQPPFWTKRPRFRRLTNQRLPAVKFVSVFRIRRLQCIPGTVLQSSSLSIFMSACLLSFFQVTNNIATLIMIFGPVVAFLSNLIPTVFHLPTWGREKNFFPRSPWGEEMKEPGNEVVIRLI